MDVHTENEVIWPQKQRRSDARHQLNNASNHQNSVTQMTIISTTVGRNPLEEME